MAVTGLAEWDAAGLLEGSRFRLHRLERDDEWIDQALDHIEGWWNRHVLEDTPPPPRDAKDLARFIRSQHPKDNGETLDLTADGASAVMLRDVDALFYRLMRLQKSRKRLVELEREAKVSLEALCGPYRGIICSHGRFAFPGMSGAVAWKKLAEAINEGPVPETLIDAHRGDSYRKSQPYPFKKKETK